MLPKSAELRALQSTVLLLDDLISDIEIRAFQQQQEDAVALRNKLKAQPKQAPTRVSTEEGRMAWQSKNEKALTASLLISEIAAMMHLVWSIEGEVGYVAHYRKVCGEGCLLCCGVVVVCVMLCSSVICCHRLKRGMLCCLVLCCGAEACRVVLWCAEGAVTKGQRPGCLPTGTGKRLYCGVVYCGVVWRAVVWCGVVWCGVVWCGVVWCGVVWCGVVWCGVVWCGVVWCGVVWCGVVWCGVVWCGVVWCGVVWCGVVWCGVVWCGVVWCGVVWCGVVWCGVSKALLPNGNGRDAFNTGNAKREGCVSERVLCVVCCVPTYGGLSSGPPLRLPTAPPAGAVEVEVLATPTPWRPLAPSGP